MTFAESTEKFLAGATWLTVMDEPAVTGMRAAAAYLDASLHPPVLAQYRLFYAGLLKRAPSAAPPEDEFEALLSEGRA